MTAHATNLSKQFGGFRSVRKRFRFPDYFPAQGVGDLELGIGSNFDGHDLRIYFTSGGTT